MRRQLDLERQRAVSDMRGALARLRDAAQPPTQLAGSPANDAMGRANASTRPGVAFRAQPRRTILMAYKARPNPFKPVYCLTLCSPRAELLVRKTPSAGQPSRALMLLPRRAPSNQKLWVDSLRRASTSISTPSAFRQSARPSLGGRKVLSRPRRLRYLPETRTSSMWECAIIFSWLTGC